MLRENSALIWAIVRRYFGHGIEADDLYQLGSLGFLKAVRGFDPDYGTQFSTYAVPKIAGEIRRYIRDTGAIKVSRGVREQARAVRSAREKLCGELRREPAISEIAAETGLTPEEIASAEIAAMEPESLQAENADGMTVESTLGTEMPESGWVDSIALRQAMDSLPEKERLTLRLRFFKGLTQEQCAKVLRVSQVQVSRLEKRAISELRLLLPQE
jgi:RNA polymerase sporulation-specific sigma factor